MFQIFSFYKFINLKNLSEIQVQILELMKSLNIYGTILLAQEGINGSISGHHKDVTSFKTFLEQELISKDYISSFTESTVSPFDKMRVSIKNEIINMHHAYNDINAGQYLNAQEWNSFLDDPTTLTIDTRNTYEINIGTFENSVNLNINKFTEFPEAFKSSYGNLNKDTKIGMFCTGGVRCEKTTAFLKEEGFNNVVHLKGGIISYLKTMEQRLSKWQGDCYVFDKRVAIDQDTLPSSYEQCYACRQPVSETDRQNSQEYKPGISCSQCITNDKINRLKMVERTEFRKNTKKKNE